MATTTITTSSEAKNHVLPHLPPPSRLYSQATLTNEMLNGQTSTMDSLRVNEQQCLRTTPFRNAIASLLMKIRDFLTNELLVDGDGT